VPLTSTPLLSGTAPSGLPATNIASGTSAAATKVLLNLKEPLAARVSPHDFTPNTCESEPMYDSGGSDAAVVCDMDYGGSAQTTSSLWLSPQAAFPCFGPCPTSCVAMSWVPVTPEPWANVTVNVTGGQGPWNCDGTSVPTQISVTVTAGSKPISGPSPPSYQLFTAATLPTTVTLDNGTSFVAPATGVVSLAITFPTASPSPSPSPTPVLTAKPTPTLSPCMPGTRGPNLNKIIPLVSASGKPILNYLGNPVDRPDDGHDPGFFISEGNSAGAAAGLLNAANFFSGGPIVGPWDEQRQVPGVFGKAFIDYATIAIGLYAAAAGISENVILTAQNTAAALIHNPTLGGTPYPKNVPMDPTYTNLPARNVFNTNTGYSLYQSNAFGCS
jgi:hypothetical protein